MGCVHWTNYDLGSLKRKLELIRGEIFLVKRVKLIMRLEEGDYD